MEDLSLQLMINVAAIKSLRTALVICEDCEKRHLSKESSCMMPALEVRVVGKPVQTHLLLAVQND